MNFDSSCILDTNSFSEMLQWGAHKAKFLMMSSLLIFFLLWIGHLISSLRTLCLAPEPKDFLLCFFLKGL